VHTKTGEHVFHIKKSSRSVTAFALIVSGYFGSSGLSLGQAADKSQASADNQLAEVIVTAQRRQENLQNVPVSALVVSGASMAQQNVNSLTSLTETMPDVHIEPHPRSGDLFIRGIGSGENQSFDQSVGTFVDDIYHGRARTTAATFLDLDRIEVLKGPQSTYFGNNAIAGALNIVTKKPTDSFDATGRLLYGMFGQYAAEVAIGGPLTDTFAARLAIIGNGSDGFIRNVNTGLEEPRTNSAAARVTLLFKPNSDLEATLKVEAGRDRQASITYQQLIDCPPTSPFVASGFCSAGLAMGLPNGLDTDENAKKAGDGTNLNTNEYVLTVNYDKWGHTFTSVSGYYDYRFSIQLDGDLTPDPLLTADAPENYGQFSQEFRVASPTDQSIQYLGGLYFQNDRLNYSQDFNYFFLTPTISSIPPFASLVPLLPLAQNTEFSQGEHSEAAFGSVSWNIIDSLKVTGGLRYSWVTKDYDWHAFFGTATDLYGGAVPFPSAQQALTNALGVGTAGTLSGSRKDEALLPSAKIQYQIDPRWMTYLSYAKGFKAGGFNGADNTGVAKNLPFEPEHVNSYEVGMKSEWFDDRLLVNVAAFRSDYTNLQVAININTGGNIRSLVQNAASSVTEGVELETQWAVTKDLRLSANVAYDDAHYNTYTGVSPTQLQQLAGQTTQNLSGRRTAFAPDWTGNLTGSYRMSLPGSYQLTTELTGFFSASYFMDGTDDPTVFQGAYARLDARMSLQSPDGHWTLALIGKNLTDRDILTFSQAFPLSLGSVGVSKQYPRNVAGQFQFHFR
jgi:iron complex outermembrane receptor protein